MTDTLRRGNLMSITEKHRSDSEGIDLVQQPKHPFFSL